MRNGQKLRVGNKLIEYGKVYRVFKIEKKGIDGKTERIIHYKPFFVNSLNDTLICSIPESGLKEANIRRPISKVEVRDLVKVLRKRTKVIKPIDANEAKDAMKLNDIYETAKVLRKFWREKKKKKDTFTKNKSDVLESAMQRVVEEFAIVQKISLTKAKERLESTLNRN